MKTLISDRVISDIKISISHIIQNTNWGTIQPPTANEKLIECKADLLHALKNINKITEIQTKEVNGN